MTVKIQRGDEPTRSGSGGLRRREIGLMTAVAPIAVIGGVSQKAPARSNGARHVVGAAPVMRLSRRQFQRDRHARR